MAAYTFHNPCLLHRIFYSPLQRTMMHMKLKNFSGVRINQPGTAREYKLPKPAPCRRWIFLIKLRWHKHTPISLQKFLFMVFLDLFQVLLKCIFK